MEKETQGQTSSGSAWEARQAFALAVVCLLVGLAIGYLFRGSQSPAAAAKATSAPASPPAAALGGHMPGLEEMKQMADAKAAPLLEKLKSDPNNTGLLIQIGSIYENAHQFKDAVGYYDQALVSDPKNISARTEKASCLYYSGDVEGAIGQLQQSLQYSPKDANSLFNLGIMKWQGKKDAKGALAAWRELLQSNPQLSPEQKAQVTKLIADAQAQVKN